MTTITMTTTTGISLARLVSSPANVRRTGAGAGIEGLAASIAAHGLLQSLVVRPSPKSAGRFEVVAGGRRLTALKLLAKQKRIGKGAVIACRVLGNIDGAEASLAENTMRQDMHPADQFEAFQALHARGSGIEDIAARFGVSAQTVRQRLRLASVSPALIRAYRDEALTLDHLTAFAVTEDHAAQEGVFAQLQDWQRSPETIRRLLTHALIPATDRRVLFAGLDAYVAAGGPVQRDLFGTDEGGWIADPALLERLVAERMERETAVLRQEGWRWIGIGTEAMTAAWNCRRVWPDRVALSEDEETRRSALGERYDELAAMHEEEDGDLPEEIVAELMAIDAEMVALASRQEAWRPEDVAIAGTVLTLAPDGSLRIERGFVRVEDEPSTASAEGAATQDGNATPIRPGQEAEAKAPALSATLQAELAAHRTAGLQAALASQPGLALRVLAQRLATEAFYHHGGETVAAIRVFPPSYVCPGLADSPARQALAAIEAEWRQRLPGDQAVLWAWLRAQDEATVLALLAVCVARGVDAGNEVWTMPDRAACLSAQVAQAASLDMRHNWTATRDSYLGRVPKALILAAVNEGAGPGIAHRLAGARKDAMVADAAELLAGTGWLPAMLRVPDAAHPVGSPDAEAVPGEAAE